MVIGVPIHLRKRRQLRLEARAVGRAIPFGPAKRRWPLQSGHRRRGAAAFAARSTRENPPRKGSSRSSTPSTPSAKPARPMSAARSTRAGARRRRSMTIPAIPAARSSGRRSSACSPTSRRSWWMWSSSIRSTASHAHLPTSPRSSKPSTRTRCPLSRSRKPSTPRRLWDG